MLLLIGVSFGKQQGVRFQRTTSAPTAQIYNDFSIPPLTQSLEELRRDFANAVFLKAEHDGKIIGSVKGHQAGDTCYIERLIVHPDYQGQGIGTALIEQIELCFRKVRRFELFPGHKSERNIYLYERLGYEIFKSQEINKNPSFVFLQKYK